MGKVVAHGLLDAHPAGIDDLPVRGDLHLGAGDGLAHGVELDVPVPVQDGNPHNLKIVGNGTGVQFYIDGVLQDSSIIPMPQFDIQNPSISGIGTNLQINAGHTVLIDDVIIGNLTYTNTPTVTPPATPTASPCPTNRIKAAPRNAK
jgi:hypothetical protein